MNVSLIYVFSFHQVEKQLELQLFKLFHNEKDIDEMAEELARKSQSVDKENRRREKIEGEMKDRKKEQGKLARELAKIDQQIKESVSFIFGPVTSVPQNLLKICELIHLCCVPKWPISFGFIFVP